MGTGSASGFGFLCSKRMGSDMADYKTHSPKGWMGDSMRGSSLGRCSIHARPGFSGHIKISPIKLDSSGYDSEGTYFGIGGSLFWVSGGNPEDGTEIDYMIRILGEGKKSRAKVIEAVKKRYPSAHFNSIKKERP